MQLDRPYSGRRDGSNVESAYNKAFVVKNGTAACWSVAPVAVAPNRWFGNTSTEELAFLGLLLMLFSLGKLLA